MAIGIDLGTSNSCVAIARSGRVEVIANQYGEPISASVVCFEDDGSHQVGNTAKARAIHAPERTITASKRLIGRYFFSEEVKKAKAVCSYAIVEGANHSVRVKVDDRVMAVPEVSALVLAEMKAIAETRLGEPVTQAVVTVPAYFNDNQRQATRDAGRIAGLEVLRLLNEPTAAALAYGFGRGLTQRVAVYDLGGGTFDISILEIGEDVFEVLSTCGDTFLGGEDFDDRLIDLLADEFHAQHRINLRNDARALETLKAAAEDAKKALSEDEHVDISIPQVASGEAGPLHLERRMDRAEYGALVGDLIQRTFKVVDEALQHASLTVRDVDGVILVGGPTRLPMIREAVSQYFQQEAKTDVDPDQVVAMGAAIHAAALVGEESDTCLLDVTPLSLRIGVAGGLAETVIERNTPVPIEQTRAFTTFRDFQQAVKIRVYQGEDRHAEQNELLGEFEFTGFKNARRGEVRIEVTFEIDTDGIVNVTARDPDTDEVASTRIHLSSGLSEDELQAIMGSSPTDGPAEDALVAVESPATEPDATPEEPPAAEPSDAVASALPAASAAPAAPVDPDAPTAPPALDVEEMDELDELEELEVDGPEALDVQAALAPADEVMLDVEADEEGLVAPVVETAAEEPVLETTPEVEPEPVAEVEPEPVAEVEVEAEPEAEAEIELDEEALDTLVELADEPAQAGGGELFDAVGTDLSQYHDDDEPKSH